MNKNKVIVILGTTASGKTKLAVLLAKKFNGEIISADSRQVYRGMDVGTGKDLAEYKIKNQKSKIKIKEVPHYLIDIVGPRQRFSVADYQKLAYQAIDDILKRGKLPIICGGTGLYISAVIEGYQLPQFKISNSKFQNLKKRLEKLSLKQLLTRLKKIDPKTYKVIDKNNRRRVMRALEIYYQTGKTKSSQLNKQKPPYDFLLLGVTFQRPKLNKRIDQRLILRLEKEGLVSEVKKLHRQGVSWKRLEAFGLEYRYIALYLQGKIDYQTMVFELKKAIHQFAKRQMTWFKRDKNIIWVSAKDNPSALVKKFLS